MDTVNKYIELFQIKNGLLQYSVFVLRIQYPVSSVLYPVFFILHTVATILYPQCNFKS